MNKLSPIQVRVLGCLMEKEETTPDHYPLTLNSLRNACNQKSSRSPVTAYSEGEVGHCIRELESLGLVREEWGARTHKYKHVAGKALNLHRRGIALMCTLMLRGPQTLGELKSHSQRMFAFDDLDDVQFALKNLVDHEPALVADLPRQPGQKEGRYAHLLCGEPDVPQIVRQPIIETTADAGNMFVFVRPCAPFLPHLTQDGSALSSFGSASSTMAFFRLGPSNTGSSFIVPHTSSTFTVTFAGPTSQDDEQWGIDNVRVSIDGEPSPVPTLGQWGLLLLGTMLILIGLKRVGFIKKTARR